MVKFNRAVRIRLFILAFLIFLLLSHLRSVFNKVIMNIDREIMELTIKEA